MSIEHLKIKKIEEFKSPENKEEKYTLDFNQEFLDFQNVEVTKTDDTKPWKPALEVKLIKNNGSILEGLDANTPFSVFRDSKGNEMIVTLATAGHVHNLHMKDEDAGSKFDYPSLQSLLIEVGQKLPPDVASQSEVSDFAIDMEKHTGKEGIASTEELKEEGILSQKDLDVAESVRREVQELNRSMDENKKKIFIEKFKNDNPDCKIQFQLVRGIVLVPVVDSPKRDTTKLFIVFGPKTEGKKFLYTMAPGRHMPKHPNPLQHKNQEGIINEESFQKSAEAWFDTAMLVGK